MSERAAVIIDHAALAANIEQIRRMTGVAVMAVVKANGYGHGMVNVAKTALGAGATALGVATIDEGIALREADISAPILVMGSTFPAEASEGIAHNLALAVYNPEQARYIANAAANKPVNVHIKIETGMNRLGFSADKIGIEQILQAANLPGLAINGIFSHLACADSDPDFSNEQLNKFIYTINELNNQGIRPPIRHISNSGGAILLGKNFHLDMVRPGIAIYGLAPEGDVRGGESMAGRGFAPVMSISAPIAHIRKIARGEGVGYGRAHIAAADSLIATIPVGYADGFARDMGKNGGHVLINGEISPIVGNVCMDMMMADITNIPNISIGDKAIFCGQSHHRRISMEQLAAPNNRINYEMATSIKRIPHQHPRNP